MMVQGKRGAGEWLPTLCHCFRSWGERAVTVSRNVLALVASLFALGVYVSGGLAQSTPATPDPYEDLTLEDAIATIEAQATQIAQLEQRIVSLSGSESRGAQAAVETGQEYQIGEVISAEVFDLTVTGVQLVPSIETYQTITPRGVFAIVYLTIVNTSNTSASFPYHDLKLETEAGLVFDYDFDATIDVTVSWYDTGIYDPVQPGLTYQTAVVFDILPTATGLKLTTTNNLFSVPLDV